MNFTCSGATDENDIALLFDKLPGTECPDLRFIDRQVVKLKADRVLGHREPSLGQDRWD
jgi:hypothetical protein